jgi:hypothetical protein
MSKRRLYFIYLILFSNVSLMSAQSNSIEIWIRSFIPDGVHSGAATHTILSNPNGSGTMVQVVPKDIPYVGRIISAITPSSCFSPDSDRLCFVTDNRGFSSDPASTARTDTKFTITFSPQGTAFVSPVAGRTVTGITKRLNCSSGTTIEEKAGKIDRDVIGTPIASGDTVQVIGQITATDQLVPCAPTLLTPSADCSFDLKWNRLTTELSVDFTYGVFPAFEIYARQPGNDWVSVFQQLPSGEAWQLAGDGIGLSIATARKSIAVKIPGISGRWQSPEPEQRFTLDFTGSMVKWTERNSLGAFLTREVKIIDIGSGNFRIDRSNDNEVLAFLGFQESLRNEISARSPQPSFIIFKKEGTTLRIEWNGLIAIKDNNARLKELIQPGVRPAKVFIFKQLQ